MTLAMVLLSSQDTHTSRAETGVFIAVLGIGMGFLMQTTMLIAQNSVEQSDLGVASSAATFFRSIGGSFGVSLFGAIFNHRLTAALATRLGGAAGQQTTGGQIDPATLNQLPAPIRTGVLESLATATSTVFLWAIVFAALIPIIAGFLRHVPLRTAQSSDEEATAGPGALTSSSVVVSPRRQPHTDGAGPKTDN